MSNPLASWEWFALSDEHRKLAEKFHRFGQEALLSEIEQSIAQNELQRLHEQRRTGVEWIPTTEEEAK